MKSKYRYARFTAFLDITGHQANDFQVDDAFWAEINRLAAAYDKPGEMVALPGYEWSGNTGVGGDRNVFFATEGRTIRRSSSVLLKSPQDTDVHHVKDLFKALEGEEAIVIAHVGGRYANLEQGHDGRIERAVEIMRRRDVKHVVVVDAERRVVGIVSIKDVLRLVLANAPGAAAAAAR